LQFEQILLTPTLKVLKDVALPLNDNKNPQHHVWGPKTLKKLIYCENVTTENMFEKKIMS